jgi:hypothetical protein
MYKFCVLLIFGLFVSTAMAADKCIAFKVKPGVQINKPDWVKQVTQPLKMMDLYHGNVVATLIDDYDIVANVDELPNGEGFCVGIKNINAVIGYNNFLVKIDMRHRLNSCSYNQVLKHEDEHINAYLSVIDDFQGKLKSSVYSAANSIMPIYVKNDSEIGAAVDKLNYKLQSHPDLILIKQQISAAEELRNAKIDESDKHYKELKKCNG